MGFLYANTFQMNQTSIKQLTLNVVSTQVLNPLPYTEEVVIEFRNNFDQTKQSFLRIPVNLNTGYNFINQYILES